MRLLFLYWKVKNAGSAQDMRGYAAAAQALGHEIAVYSPDDVAVRLGGPLAVDRFDAVVFILEARLNLEYAARLDLAKLLSRLPRSRRVVLDCDGMYGAMIEVDGDRNHLDDASVRWRTELYDSLADKICQPTPAPPLPNVRSFLFHGYDPAWERPLSWTVDGGPWTVDGGCQALAGGPPATGHRPPATVRSAKPYGLIYVGSNWHRWRALARVLMALAPIRAEVGRIALVGHDWMGVPDLIRACAAERAYESDPALLGEFAVELREPVPVEQVIDTMSEAICNPVLIRPLFHHLGLVTVRTFETLAADTIPLFAQRPEYVRAIYGEAALPLTLTDHPTEQIRDVLTHPERYALHVAAIRAHLAQHHSYQARLRQLVEIVES